MRFDVVSSAVFVLLSVLARNAWAKSDVANGSSYQTDYCAMINSGLFLSTKQVSSSGRSIVSNDSATQKIRTLYDQSLPSPIIDRITMVEVEKNCVPLKRFSKREPAAERLEWSLADCNAIKSIPEKDLNLCRDIDIKMSSVLKRDFTAVAKEYGYPDLLPGSRLATIIIDRCKREPVTELLLKDSAVVNYLNKQDTLIRTEPAKTRTASPAK